MSLEPVAHISQSKIDNAIDNNTRHVLNLLQQAKVPVRIVGGAVRDLLLDKDPRDVDLVADIDPTALIYLFEGHGIAVDLSGIKHGTVKAVFGRGEQEEKVEVSSLGYRIKRHGHRLTIDRTHSWKTDSELRDLTINSMSMDTGGRVYDYTGGLKDLRNQTVRMSPHSRDNFVLDPNTIMRYFKATSMFADPKVSPDDIKWLKQNIYRLGEVADDKKVQMNMISILKSAHRHKTLNLMCGMGVQKYLNYIPCELG